MFLSHLSLTHFRNYRSLELDFNYPLTLLQGQNAQGKSNLLEAIYLIATSKPVHAQNDQEVIGWSVEEAPLPHSRIAATIVATAPSTKVTDMMAEKGVDEHDDLASSEKPLEIEILYTPREQSNSYKKQIRINGVNRRALDLVGKMRAVLFLPEDIKLVAGSPGERRRYLDVALCQIDRQYTQALSRFQKVVTQRNSLLKSLREQGSGLDREVAESQLHFWDEQLVDYGSTVIAKRCGFVADLIPTARQRHWQLSSDAETLTLLYVPSFNPGYMSDATHAKLKDSPSAVISNSTGNVMNNALNSAESRLEHEDDPFQMTIAALTNADPIPIAQAYMNKLTSRRNREIAAGVTLYGPHRDDLAFVANGRDLRTYGSRGQQRSAALSLKLAEVQTMTERTGTPPVLLLDDVMSELDVRRRSMLLDALGGIRQAIITTTDWDDFEPDFLARAGQLTVSEGMIGPRNQSIECGEIDYQ
ncbi:MAG: DNA replication/repair protein RecF [Chloroflexota bacterium]